MMKMLARTLVPLALLLAAQTAAAQVGEKKFLTLDGAKKAAAAAEADARRRNLPVVIAVVDDAGELLVLERMDGTQTGSLKVGIGKARTAAQFKRPTKFFEDQIKNGRIVTLALAGFHAAAGRRADLRRGAVRRRDRRLGRLAAGGRGHRHGRRQCGRIGDAMKRALPAGCGIGLRKEHFDVVLGEKPAVPFFEVISENFMVDGGRPLAVLERVRRDYPLAVHGVSLSLGSAEPVDRAYLARLKTLVDRFDPAVVSDHLCWTGIGGHNSHDLLPMPLTEEAARATARKIRQVQDALGRRILVENISSYVEFSASALSEGEFLRDVAEKADCGILLDVNNLYVNSRNHGLDTGRFLDRIPAGRVGQMHLAGHEDHGDLVIDTHDHPVADAVWALYEEALRRFGPVPTLIEWDAQIPPFEVVLAEARRAEAVQASVRAEGEAHARTAA